MCATNKTMLPGFFCVAFSIEEMTFFEYFENLKFVVYFMET